MKLIAELRRCGCKVEADRLIQAFEVGKAAGTRFGTCQMLALMALSAVAGGLTWQAILGAMEAMR